LNRGVERSFNGCAWQACYDNTSFAVETVPEPANGLIFVFGELIATLWLGRKK